MAKNSLFDQRTKELNLEQRKAVDSIEGPLMIVAGPGTGKTHVLTMRIANILRRIDIGPENILALTFTDAAAREMRSRIVELIGPAGYRVNATTFHGFCNDVIKSHPDLFPYAASRVPASDADRVRIARHILNTTLFEYIRPPKAPLHYQDLLLNIVSAMKREGIPEDDLGELLKERSSDDSGERIREAEQFYRAYQQEMKKMGLYDYDDMMVWAVGEMERNRDLLLELQETYHYLMADEHQDANSSQNKVLQLLASYHDHPNLCVVGDPRQAIFRFQGALKENFDLFRSSVKEMNVVSLTFCYRSSSPILRAALNVAREDPSSLSSLSLCAVPVIAHKYSTEQDEEDGVAGIVKQILGKEHQASVAVLCRDNKTAIHFASALERAGIPTVLEGERNIFDQEDVRGIMALLQAVHEYGNEELLTYALHTPHMGVHPLDTYKAMEYARKNRMSLYDALNEKIPGVSPKGRSSLRRAGRLLASWALDREVVSPCSLLNRIVREFGVSENIARAPDAVERSEAVRSLLRQARSLTSNPQNKSFSSFMESLLILRERGVPGGVQAGEGVRVITVHKAKGREFDYVVIPRMVNGVWSGKRTRRLFWLPPALEGSMGTGEEGEERNVLFVALTRARTGVVLTMPRESTEGREYTPSPYLEDINPEFRDPPASADLLAQVREEQKPSIANADYVSSLFEERGLSVTALNNYLVCPWRYVYVNLIRIPRYPTVAQMYGTAVHESLSKLLGKPAYALRRATAGKQKTVAILLNAFETTLKTMGLSAAEEMAILKKGRTALKGYHQARKDIWNNVSDTEVVVRVALDDIRLTGKIDRIDRTDNKDIFHVVDYKTKTPMSRNAIEGKTKNSDGSYKRQLVFYKILLDRFWGGKRSVATAELDFVEPNARGLYKREVFELNEQDVAELEETIARVANEICSLSFWNTDCGCEYCILSRGMKSSK